MKKLLIGLSVFAALMCVFRLPCAAAEDETAFGSLYGEVFGAIDDETRSLLGAVGIDGDPDALSGLSPEGIVTVLARLFSVCAKELRGVFGSTLVLIVLLRLSASFLSSDTVREGVENVGGVFAAFLLISASAAVADACRNAVLITKNFMLALVPMLGTAVAFSGSPATALTTNALVFSFAEGVSVLFSDAVAPLAAAGAAFGTAAVLSPVGGIEKFASLLNRAVTWGMALVAGVFSAVLGIRGVLAGAADGVSSRGIRFVISGAVPVVGSAIGDALSSLSAGLGLIKNSAAALGILAAAFINLPPLASLVTWKLLLWTLSMAAELFEIKKLPGFLGVLGASFNVIAAVMVFNVFVYVIALAIYIKAKTA